MITKILSDKDYQLFLFKALFVLGLAWAGFLLTLVGFFYVSIVWILTFLATAYFAKKAHVSILSIRPSMELAIASTVFLFAAILFSFFSTPTVFSGRDQGSFSQAAIRLSQNHKLEFSTPTSSEFFKLHEPGRALNFPGFYYDNNGQLVTQFTLVYISWLALFFGTFGMVGFQIANGLLLFTFFLSFYLLSRLFMKTSSAIPTISLALTSFTFMWFSKYTLSENLALPLIWLSILSLMLFLKKQRTLNFLIFILTSTLLCFSRIEGIALLFTSAIILYFNKKTHDYLKEKMFTRAFIPAFIFLLIFALNAFIDRYFFREIAKALLPEISTPKAQLLEQGNVKILPDFYALKIFFHYGLVGFFTAGIFSVALIFAKKEFGKLIPLFVILPTFIYFFDANISSDHPWMLRRYMITLLPVAIFYSGLLIAKLLEKKQKPLQYRAVATVIFAVLFGMNLPAFGKYISFSENKNLLNQTKKLSEKFKANDLILIDRNATGDGWSMIADPMSSLFGKNAVYFFNTADLANLDTEKFDNIYLIASNQQTGYYLSSTIGPKLSEFDQYDFNFSRLDISQEKTFQSVNFPEKKNFSIQGKIFKITK